MIAMLHRREPSVRQLAPVLGGTPLSGLLRTE